ncbi:MDR family MFS transporter [Streptomyces europaeiscabiei]|uniref:MDR family MFS transporter n=1 Tax=Streptomyces europaeiscabiei TaxID=146819 RepID=UPI0029B532BA|nr:MFS transporter [Streptomyces europaeiscabiei]MDX3583342.1 MFS transporter [Streptomyces europaeiscabiei]
MPSNPLLAARRVMTESFAGLPAPFWWLWVATLVNRLAGFVATFLAMYLTLGLGYSASFAGLIGSLYGGGASAASVIGGSLTDRIGRRPTVLAAQLATSLSIIALGLVESRLLIALLAFVVGLVSHVSRPAFGAMIADMVPEEDRPRAYSLNFWAANIGFGVSAAAAGLLAEQGYILLFIGESVATLICAVLVFLKVPETRKTDTAQSAGKEGGVGFGVVLKDGTFMCLVGMTFLVVVLFQQAATTLPIIMGREGFSSADYGLVLSVNGLLIVLLQIPVSRITKGKRPLHLLVVASLLCGYGFGLTAFADSLLLYAATVSLWTVGEIIFAPVGMQLTAQLAPEHARGRYQGMYGLSWSLTALVTPVASGFVIDHAGSEVIWGACAVIGTVAACGHALLHRKVTARTTSDAYRDGDTQSAHAVG